MPNGDLQCDARAVAEAEEIGLRNLKVPKQPGDVVGRTLEREWLIAIGGTSVALLFEGDHSAGAGKEWEYLAKVRVDRRAATVEQNERCPVVAAMNFVIDMDAVYERAARLDLRGVAGHLSR